MALELWTSSKLRWRWSTANSGTNAGYLLNYYTRRKFLLAAVIGVLTEHCSIGIPAVSLKVIRMQTVQIVSFELDIAEIDINSLNILGSRLVVES